MNTQLKKIVLLPLDASATNKEIEKKNFCPVLLIHLPSIKKVKKKIFFKDP